MTGDPPPIGVVLIGCGRISGAHLTQLAALPQDFRLIAAVDPHPERAAAAAAAFAALALTDLDEALALPGVEAVIICSPNAAHAPQAMAALRAGKHVLVEKPLAESGDDACSLAAEAQARGLQLAAGHTFRHGPAVRHMQDHFARFGKLRAVEVSQCVFWDGPQAPWWADRTADEGLIVSLFAPHQLDFIQLVMGGDRPTRVHAEGARHQSSWQAEDEAMVMLAYERRRMAMLHISYNQLPIHDRKVLFFDSGVLEIQNGETLLWNGMIEVAPAHGTITDPGSMGGRDLSHFFRTQLAEFSRAVRGLPHRCAGGHEAAGIIDLIDRVRASIRANSHDAIDPPIEG